MVVQVGLLKGGHWRRAADIREEGGRSGSGRRVRGLLGVGAVHERRRHFVRAHRPAVPAVHAVRGLFTRALTC